MALERSLDLAKPAAARTGADGSPKPGSILTSLRSAIAKGEYKGTKVVMRGGEIFLVREK